MPDRRLHRGPHPEDQRLFAAEACPGLRAAAHDLAWLLDHEYPSASSLKLVGDRYQLVTRQRTAVMRATCSEAQRNQRRQHEIPLGQLRGQTLLVDGYNLLTTVEAALAGGVILAAADGTFRDMASMHGSYRKVAETRPAIDLVGRTLATYASACRWYLDRPVSNSGRLRALLLAAASESQWDWRVELVNDPDPILRDASQPVATADCVVLDACRQWVNLARDVVCGHVPDAWIVGFREPTGGGSQSVRLPGKPAG
jgi:hypothetical protein